MEPEGRMVGHAYCGACLFLPPHTIDDASEFKSGRFGVCRDGVCDPEGSWLTVIGVRLYVRTEREPKEKCYSLFFYKQTSNA